MKINSRIRLISVSGSLVWTYFASDYLPDTGTPVPERTLKSDIWLTFVFTNVWIYDIIQTVFFCMVSQTICYIFISKNRNIPTQIKFFLF